MMQKHSHITTPQLKNSSPQGNTDQVTDDVVVVAVVVFAIGDYDYDVDVDDGVDVNMDQFCFRYFLFMALIRQTSMHLAFSKPINNLDGT